MYFLKVKQDEVVPATYAWADGWNGHAQHVWDKEYIESIYPDQRERYIPSIAEEAGRGRTWGGQRAVRLRLVCSAWPQRLGIRRRYRQMSDYADAHFEPDVEGWGATTTRSHPVLLLIQLLSRLAWGTYTT